MTIILMNSMQFFIILNLIYFDGLNWSQRCFAAVAIEHRIFPNNQFVDINCPCGRKMLLSDRMYSSLIWSMSKSAFSTRTWKPNQIEFIMEILVHLWICKLIQNICKLPALDGICVHESASLHGDRAIASSNPS